MLFWPNSTNYLQESHENGGLETLFWRKKANYQQESDEHDKCEVVDCQGTAALHDYFAIIIATTKGPKLGMQAGTTVKTRKANGGQDSHVVPSVGLQVSKSTAKPRSAPFSVRRQALGCAWSAFTCRVKVRALASHRERAPPTDPRGQGWAPRRQASAAPMGPLGPWAPPRPLGPAVKRSG